jgi:hypothetical protein
MIENKNDFYKCMQANIVLIRTLVETERLLAALPAKICECVRTEDKNLRQFAELFEMKVRERETVQAEQRERAQELKEAQTRLFAVLPHTQAIEKISAAERAAVNSKLGSFFEHATKLEEELTEFRETHEGPTDVDESIQNFMDVMNGLQLLLGDLSNSVSRDSVP